MASELPKPAKMVEACADHLADMSLHGQLAVKQDAEVANIASPRQ